MDLLQLLFSSALSVLSLPLPFFDTYVTPLSILIVTAICMIAADLIYSLFNR